MLATRGGDFNNVTKVESTMLPDYASRPDASASSLSDHNLGFHAEVVCRFSGLPGEYLISSREHLLELAQDPVGFAADLAGLSRAGYLCRLAGEVV